MQIQNEYVWKIIFNLVITEGDSEVLSQVLKHLRIDVYRLLDNKNIRIKLPHIHIILAYIHQAIDHNLWGASELMKLYLCQAKIHNLTFASTEVTCLDNNNQAQHHTERMDSDFCLIPSFRQK